MPSIPRIYIRSDICKRCRRCDFGQRCARPGECRRSPLRRGMRIGREHLASATHEVAFNPTTPTTISVVQRNSRTVHPRRPMLMSSAIALAMLGQKRVDRAADSTEIVCLFGKLETLPRIFRIVRTSGVRYNSSGERGYLRTCQDRFSLKMRSGPLRGERRRVRSACVRLRLRSEVRQIGLVAGRKPQ